MKFPILLAAITVLVSYTSESKAQIKITGPTCVVPDFVYQYSVTGLEPNNKNIRVCISGGEVIGKSSPCYEDSIHNMLFVKWNDNIQAGSFSIQEADTQSAIDVRITTSLLPGRIDDSSKNQTISYMSVPNIINCMEASGGGCTENFAYQWEQSEDNISWKEVPGAVDKNILIKVGLPITTFFRRKVINKPSNNTAYSDVAVVFVEPELK